MKEHNQPHHAHRADVAPRRIAAFQNRKGAGRKREVTDSTVGANRRRGVGVGGPRTAIKASLTLGSKLEAQQQRLVGGQIGVGRAQMCVSDDGGVCGGAERENQRGDSGVKQQNRAQNKRGKERARQNETAETAQPIAASAARGQAPGRGRVQFGFDGVNRAEKRPVDFRALAPRQRLHRFSLTHLGRLGRDENHGRRADISPPNEPGAGATRPSRSLQTIEIGRVAPAPGSLGACSLVLLLDVDNL